MNIILVQHEIEEAIRGYVKDKHGMDIDVGSIREVSVEYQEMELAHQKYRNGRLKKDENGFSKVDWDASKWVTKNAHLGEGFELHFCVEVENGE